MQTRALVALLLVASSAFPFAAMASGGTAGTMPLDLGYGPSTLFPAQDGTPVFTAGDQVWAMSHFNTTVVVKVSPAFTFVGGINSTLPSKPVEPGVPVKLLTVNATDQQGLWTVQVVGSNSPSESFLVSDAQAESADLALSAFRLAKGSLEMNFTTSPDLQMYGASACIAGGADASVAQIPLPSGIGQGYVNVSRSLDSLQAVPSQGSANYSLSVGLFRSVSFLLPGSASTLVSRLVQVASTEPELVSGGVPVSLALRHDGQLWPGRYQLRVVFEGAGGTFLSTADVVAAGPGWVWLGACSVYPVYSNDFGLSVRLGSDPGSWPRSAMLTYDVFGEQGVAYLPLKVNLSAVEFVGIPWGVKLSGYGIRVDSTSGVRSYGVSDGTIFAALDAPVGQIGYEAGPGRDYYFSGSAGPLTPFAAMQVGLNVSKLVVQYLVSGSGYAGGTVKVSGSAGVLENATTGPSGTATFYLPTGRYNVTANGGNSSASGTTDLVAGRSQELVLGASGGGLQTTILLALGFAAVLGAMANAAVWVRRREQTRGHGSRLSQK